MGKLDFANLDLLLGLRHSDRRGERGYVREHPLEGCLETDYKSLAFLSPTPEWTKSNRDSCMAFRSISYIPVDIYMHTFIRKLMGVNLESVDDFAKRSCFGGAVAPANLAFSSVVIATEQWR